MTPFPRLPAVAGFLLLCMALPACTGTAPTDPMGQDPTQETPAAEASPAEPTTADPANDAARGGQSANWADWLGDSSAPDGWRVMPCENPALLCVEANGDGVGTVEHFSYPIRETAWAGETPTTPAVQRQFLDAWVADHQSTIEQDRAVSTPNLRFTHDLPSPFPVGRLPGLRYGYALSDAQGVVRERTVGYVATDGERVYVFATGVITGDPTGPFRSESDLSAFEPHLATIIEGLQLGINPKK